MPDFETAEGVAHGLRPDDLLDKPVYDLDGHLLGRVKLCREVEGAMTSFDVELVPKARRAFHVLQDAAPLDPADVVAADDTVTLRESGDVLLHPELPQPRTPIRERS